MADNVLPFPVAPDAAPVRLMHPIEEAAELLGIGRTVTYGLVRSGELRSVLIGKRRLIARADLEAFVDRLRSEALPYADTAP